MSPVPPPLPGNRQPWRRLAARGSVRFGVVSWLVLVTGFVIFPMGLLGIGTFVLWPIAFWFGVAGTLCAVFGISKRTMVCCVAGFALSCSGAYYSGVMIAKLIGNMQSL
jgi:hypothetical protein